MSWKTQTIFVRPARLDGGPKQLLADLGYDNPVEVGDASFHSAGRGSIWIGAFDDGVVIYTPLAWLFFPHGQDGESPEFGPFGDALLRHLAAAEITVVCLDARVGAWGFAVFRDGRLIRRSHGYDGMVVCDDGPRLPFEQAYLQKFERLEVEDEIQYRDPEHPEHDDMSEADLDDSLAVELFESMSGAPFDDAKFNPNGIDFWLSEAERQHHAHRLEAALAAQRRPWWKFW